MAQSTAADIHSAPPAPAVGARSDEPPVPNSGEAKPLVPPVGSTLIAQPKDFLYEVVEGFFIQDGPFDERVPTFEADVLPKSFGLVDQSPERWKSFRTAVAGLQDEAEAGVKYKVFFLARHGEGWHNACMKMYGKEAWSEKWGALNTDGNITWAPDPSLTPLGITQAQKVHAAWVKEAAAGAPIGADEMKWYCSPMVRTGETLLHTWGDLLAGRPEVWEDWRELLGKHPCNRRNPRSMFEARFPGFDIESDMSEADLWWQAGECESELQMQDRMLRVMDRVFGPEGTDKTFVSVTTHSATLKKLMAVVGHRPYPLSTCEITPVVVKATPVVRG